MKKYFIVSDVHSFYTPLMETLNNNGFDLENEEHILVVNGDLFDRGDESKLLLDFVKSLEDRFIYVRGNHEDLLTDLYVDIMSNKPISSHHYSNGTVKTITDLCDLSPLDFNHWGYTDSAKQKIRDIISPLIDWINLKSTNYFEINNKYIITHCWVPLIEKAGDYSFYAINKKYESIYEYWNANTDTLDDLEFMTYYRLWQKARWGNPFECWKQGMVPEGKVIISGHWHTSYGFSHIDQKLKEWPEKNRKDWQKSFEIWERDNFLALDGCVAYSGKINCLVIDEE